MADNLIPLPRAVTGLVVGADVGALASQHPAWEIGVGYVTANSGPDARFLWARQGRVILTGWSPASLAIQIRDHQE